METLLNKLGKKFSISSKKKDINVISVLNIAMKKIEHIFQMQSVCNSFSLLWAIELKISIQFCMFSRGFDVPYIRLDYNRMMALRHNFISLLTIVFTLISLKHSFI
jgi:hypothetical protein